MCWLASRHPLIELWVQGRLLDELGIRDDGRTRVEIIGGEIVVSLLPTVDHGGMVSDIQRMFYRAKFTTTLYSDPETEAGAYRESQVWRFGETINLPEPFSVEIPTDGWEAWDED